MVCALALGATMAVTLSAGAGGREANAMLRDANGAVVTVAAAADALQIPPGGLL